MHLTRRMAQFLTLTALAFAAVGVTPVADAQTTCGTEVTVQPGQSLTIIAQNCGVSYSAVLQANPQIADPSLIYAGEVVNMPSAAIPITGPQISLEPLNGVAGTQVTVTGGGFPAEADLALAVAPLGETSAASVSAATDSSGAFSAEITIPSSAQAGSVWQIQAATASNGGPSATANFQVIAPPPTGPYIVQSGDTLSGLAIRYGTSISALLRANPQISNPSQLAVGVQLDIPGSLLPASQTGAPEYIVRSGDTLGQIAVRYGLTLQSIERSNPGITNPSLILPGQHVLLTPTVAIPVTGSQLQIAPASGGPGSQLTIDGTGFPANTSLSVTAAPHGQPAVVTKTVTSEATGAFSLQINIPSDAQPASQWTITAAATPSGGPSASAVFSVLAPVPSGPYTVRSGDTLSGLALAFNTTLNAMIKANPQIASLAQLTPGEQLYIPGSVVTIASSGVTVYFAVQGDNMSQVASRFGVSLPALEQANPQIAKPALIFPGQRIVIPTASIPVTGSQLLLTPSAGSAGTSFQAVASGFPADTSVSVTLAPAGGTPTTSTSATTDANGSFAVDLAIPKTAATESEWTVTASVAGSGGPSATAEFRVAALPPSGPYTVKSGDTLVSIAQTFGTSVGALLRANPQLASLNPLNVGQQLYIPGSMIAIPNSPESLYIVKSGDSLSRIAAEFGASLAAVEQANPQLSNPGLIYSGEHIMIPTGS